MSGLGEYTNLTILVVIIILGLVTYEAKINHATCQNAGTCPNELVNDPEKLGNLCSLKNVCEMSDPKDVEACCSCVYPCTPEGYYGTLNHHYENNANFIVYLIPILADIFNIFILFHATWLYWTVGKTFFTYASECTGLQVFFYMWDLINHLFLHHEDYLWSYHYQLYLSRLSLITITYRLYLLKTDRKVLFTCIAIWFFITPYFSKIEDSGHFANHRHAWRTHFGICFANYLAFYLPSLHQDVELLKDEKKEIKTSVLNKTDNGFIILSDKKGTVVDDKVNNGEFQRSKTMF